MNKGMTFTCTNVTPTDILAFSFGLVLLVLAIQGRPITGFAPVKADAQLGRLWKLFFAAAAMAIFTAVCGELTGGI